MRLKLFENFNEDDLETAIRECFGDMIDDEKIEIEVTEEEIMVWLDIETNYETTSIQDFLSTKEKEMSLLKEIKISLDRIPKNFDVEFDVDCEFDVSRDKYQLLLRFTPGKSKEGSFYKITRYGIKFDYNKLKEILKLPKQVDISLWSGGRLSFKFKNEEELNSYKNKLIEDFKKLRIEEKPLIGEISWSYSTRTGDEMAPYKIYTNYKQTYHSGSGQRTETINSVDFGLNSELEYTW